MKIQRKWARSGSAVFLFAVFVSTRKHLPYDGIGSFSERLSSKIALYCPVSFLVLVQLLQLLKLKLDISASLRTK